MVEYLIKRTMTTLTKPVTRRAENTTVQGRALIITLRPGLTETVHIREAGRRTGYTVPLDRIYKLGAHMEAEAQRKLKADKKKQRRKAQNR